MSVIIQRQKKLRQKLAKIPADALLISNFYSILYLTGFKTLTTEEREAFAVVTKKKTYLISDGRYFTKNFQFPVSNFQTKLIKPGKGFLFHLKEIAGSEKIKTLGIEDNDLRVQEYEKIKRTLPAVKLASTGNLLLKLREIKENDEIKNIAKACKITDQCLAEISKIVAVGMTEKEVAFRIEIWLKKKGYDIAFSPIVAVDKNSAIPHYDTRSGSGKIGPNSVVLLDFGAKYQNYSSDISRMIFMGKNDKARKTYDQLLAIQQKTIKQIRKTREAKSLDNFCRQKLKEAGLPNFSHSTGHGVGLEIHEYPKISFVSADTIRGNQVFTIEPGVYFPGQWGIRIEDTVMVSENLAPVRLTKSPV